MDTVRQRRSAVNAPPETEAELEAFRRQWRDEVSARRSSKPARSRTGDVPQELTGKAVSTTSAGPSTARRKEAIDYSEDVEPSTYHDLPNREEHFKLGAGDQAHHRDSLPEPVSALEHYEKAVEKETQGQLGDSLRHYQRAFKLDSGVHEAYKRKHFPPSAFVKPKLADPNPSNKSGTVLNTAHHSLHGGAAINPALPATLQQLVDEFSTLRIEAKEPETSLSAQKRCPIAELPEEILAQVLMQLAIIDVASFTRLAQVCKRLAYLVLTEDSVWKRVAAGPEFGFAAMHYDFACSIEGVALQRQDILDQLMLGASSHPFIEDPLVVSSITLPTPKEQRLAFATLTEQLLRDDYASSWRQLFRTRPRVRFNGCYISTVNYTRAGGNNTNTLTWGAPVHIVTYFRYLRFFRDGSVISLLTTAEPADVVHHLIKDNLHTHHGSFLPSSVMKDALRGRWRLTGPHHRYGLAPASDILVTEPEKEVEGDVLVETQGVNPRKYDYKLHLALAHAGKGARNNKLAWKGFWSYNKLTDDWGEFGLKNYRPFYWSRVKSYETR